MTSCSLIKNIKHKRQLSNLLETNNASIKAMRQKLEAQLQD